MSLNIVIDADVQTATAKIGKFVYTFKESFKEVEDTVKRTSSKVKQETDSISNSVNSFGKSSRNSLTALSLTIQDLPFGFIGIQNNLPGIVQGFAEMSAQAKNGTSVLSQLKGALVGPAGLFLAFSAVTAIVTVAVQKYGSLSAAVNALFGILPKVNAQQKIYNEAVKEAAGDTATEEAKLRILLKTLNDSSQPTQKRLDSYNELKRVQPDVVAGLRDENALTSDGIELINQNAKARLELLKLKIKESGINAVLIKNAEEQTVTSQELNVASAEYVRNSDAYIKSLNNQLVKGQALVILQNNAYGAFKSSALEVSKLLIKQKELTKISEDYYKQLEPIIENISAINAATDQRKKDLKEENDSLKEQNKKLKDLAQDGQEKYRLGWKGIIAALKEYDAAMEANKKANQRAISFNVDTQFKKIAEQTKKATLEQENYRKGMEGIISALQQRDSFKMEDPFPFDWVARFEENVAGIQRVIDQTNAVAFMKQNFTDPMSELFLGFIETGKFAFEEFGKVVLKTINQIVAKIIATGIINLLGSILFPGAVGGTKGVLGAFIGAFNSVLGFGGAGVANPSFVGVGGGTFGLSGQVNLVLRGQDLVGSLNRTNTLINRVG